MLEGCQERIVIRIIGELIHVDVAISRVRPQKISGQRTVGHGVPVLRIYVEKLSARRHGIDIPLPKQVASQRSRVSDGDDVGRADPPVNAQIEVVDLLLVRRAGERIDSAAWR